VIQTTAGMSTSAVPPNLDANIADRARRRIGLRLLPFLFLLYVIAFLDRVNVGFAGLEMSRDLGFSDRVFGFGAGIFFVGYFLFEIPGALIVERWSARRWIARILVTWGIITALVATVHTPRQFYAARFLLGLAEAGFFPGILVYLSHWFRRSDRAKAGAIFMAAIPVSNIVGSPVAGWLLGRHWLHFEGWRWLFILEGVPAVALGIVTLFYLTDWPQEARWLPRDEQEWINNELRLEKQALAQARTFTIGEAIRQRDVILLTFAYFLSTIGVYGFNIWFPTIVKRASGLPDLGVTLLSALPYVAGAFAMLWIGWHSDRAAERRWHTALPLFATGLFLGLALAFRSNLAIGFLSMTVVGACSTAFMPSFWALPGEYLTESAAAASIGLINSVGNLGGFVGPFAIGYLRTAENSFVPGLAFVMVASIIAGAIILTLTKPRTATKLASEWKPSQV
jgi:ACS family tartrate transporter-like MFS transporter